MSKKQTTLELFTKGNGSKPTTSKYFSKDQKGFSSDSVEILSSKISAPNKKYVQSASSNSTTASSKRPKDFSPPPPPKCVLISNERFELISFQYFQNLSDVCQNIPTAVYNPLRKRWNFHLSVYNEFMKSVQNVKINVEGLPNVVKAACHSIISTGQLQTSKPLTYDMKNVDRSILNILFPFQLEAVNFVISKNGRALIADEMGLGKTLEALAVASYYCNEWPLLIVSPASVRHTWVQAVRKFFSRDYLSPHNVFSPNSNKEMANFSPLTSKSKSVLVISYDLMKTQLDILLEKNFRVVILDESHFIKNFKSERSKAAFKILKNASRAVLLSGTPALSRPVELFPQLQCINDKIFKNFNEFVNRYCDAKKRPKHFGGGLDTSGASNLEELEILLKETIMIRRIKADVMNQLQPKKRSKIILSKNLLETKEDEMLDLAKKNFFDESLTKKDKRKALVEFFNATSKAKIKPVVNHVLSLVRQGRKMVVFAHHQLMMNNLQSAVVAEGVQMIRIEGATSSENRQKFCDKFQKDDQVKVALLSITAACTGLTLTAANLVVFAELFWNPGVLVQAEDRVHRKGQESDVEVLYLLAQGTADDEIWRLLKEKNSVLGQGGLSKDNFDDMPTTVISHQPNITGAPNRKTTLDDFWEDQNFDGGEILEDNFDLYTTTSGLKINLNEIFPAVAKEFSGKNLELRSYPIRTSRNFLPVLKISELKHSLTDLRIRSKEKRPGNVFMDTTFCENIEELFYEKSSNRSFRTICEPFSEIFSPSLCPKIIQNESELKQITTTNLDTTFVDNVEDMFQCSRIDSQAIKFNIDTLSPSAGKKSLTTPMKPSLSPNFELDFSFDFGLGETRKGDDAYENAVDTDLNESQDCIPPSPEVDRIPASLPIHKNSSDNENSGKTSNETPISSSVDQCCSPIFKARFVSSNISQKPLATVRPFKINDEIVDDDEEPGPSRVGSPPKKKSKLIQFGNEFIDAEAEESNFGSKRIVSSDESESTDDENVYLADSFVDHDSEPEYFNTQKKSNSPEMRAIYLKSINSSQNFGRRNKFKLAYGVGANLDVYSQRADDSILDDEQDDSFCYDSFVVPNDFVEYATTEKKHKNNKKRLKVKKRRRLLTQNSSDSDEN